MNYTASFYYSAIVFAISAFRVIMYIINFTYVVEVKVSKQAWEDLKVREVAIAWCQVIRVFMAFRTAMTFLILLMEESVSRQYFCLLNVALDIKLLHGLVYVFIYGKENGYKAIVHHGGHVPVTLQCMILLPGLVYAYMFVMKMI